MEDWNVVVTVRNHRFAQAWPLLETFGQVAKTAFYNVLVVKVGNSREFLNDLHARLAAVPAIAECIARVAPVTQTFLFQTPEAFERQIVAALTPWLPGLEGQSFYVRMHRRGFKGRLKSQEEERFLDHYILKTLAEAGQTATVEFHDPDVVIDVETVGQRAGLAVWRREELARYPLVKVD